MGVRIVHGKHQHGDQCCVRGGYNVDGFVELGGMADHLDAAVVFGLHIDRRVAGLESFLQGSKGIIRLPAAKTTKGVLLVGSDVIRDVVGVPATGWLAWQAVSTRDSHILASRKHTRFMVFLSPEKALPGEMHSYFPGSAFQVEHTHLSSIVFMPFTHTPLGSLGITSLSWPGVSVKATRQSVQLSNASNPSSAV